LGWQLTYSKAALRDLADLQRFLTRKSRSLEVGKRDVEVPRGQCRKMALLSAQLGRPRPELSLEIRSFAFQNYLILVRYEGGCARIVNVIEEHRDIEAVVADGDS
jgi:plasmid stabilization system protein ParE